MKTLTIKDVLDCPRNELQKKVFIFSKNYKQEEKYFSFKLNYLGGKTKSEIMISLIDMSQEVLRNNEKAHNELLIMINATVSHELRNPLNSIIALNMQKRVLYEKLQKLLMSETLTI
jgi:signal transduction histidine kinase